MSELNALALSPIAVSMLGQLYVGGPTWDGNVISKAGRGELVKAGLAWHEHGYAALTPEGVRVAVEWDWRDLKNRGEDKWLSKRRAS